MITFDILWLMHFKYFFKIKRIFIYSLVVARHMKYTLKACYSTNNIGIVT